MRLYDLDQLLAPVLQRWQKPRRLTQYYRWHEDDENGHMMRPIALVLIDENIDNVVTYIMTLDPNFVEEE